MVATSYLLEASTRRVYKLVEQLGIKHILQKVSQMATVLDGQMETFRTRTLARTRSSGWTR